MPHPFDPCPHVERMPDTGDVRQSAATAESIIVWSCVAVGVAGVLLLAWWIAGVFVENELRRAVADQEVLLGSSYRSIAMARSVGL